MRENKTIYVNCYGGVVGIFNSQKRMLNKATKKANMEGWSVKQIIEGEHNFFARLGSKILLLCTFGAYTFKPAYTIMLEREVNR